MSSQLRLVAITDPIGGWAVHEPACRAALDAGLPALMLRDRATPDADLLPVARRLADAARAAGALLIVNRRPEVARVIGAEAVHLGKDGPTLADARAALGNGVIAGYSAHSAEEALAALAGGFDYVTLSPIFATPKPWDNPTPLLGLEPLRDLCTRTQSPVVALGGIGIENALAALAAGATGVAAIRAVFSGAPAANVQRFMLSLR